MTTGAVQLFKLAGKGCHGDGVLGVTHIYFPVEVHFPRENPIDDWLLDIGHW
jgi:hypothetical protein